MSTQSSTCPGTSTISTGVRPGRRSTSIVVPGRERASSSAQRRMSCTAASMWPCASQSGSNMGDLLGIRTYSTSSGRIDSSQRRSTKSWVSRLSMILTKSIS